MEESPIDRQLKKGCNQFIPATDEQINEVLSTGGLNTLLFYKIVQENAKQMDYSAHSSRACVRNDKYRARAKRHSHAHELQLIKLLS